MVNRPLGQLCVCLYLFFSIRCIALEDPQDLKIARRRDDPQAIIDRAILAVGGEEAIAKQKVMSVKMKTGAVDAMVPINFIEITQQTPNQYKLVIEMPNPGAGVADKISLVMNGKNAFIFGNGQKQEMPQAVQDPIDQVMYALDLCHLFALRDKNVELAQVKETKIDGKAAFGLTVSSKGHRDVMLYFDPTTNLPATCVFQDVDGAGKVVSSEMQFSDFKDYEGVKHWSKIVLSSNGVKGTEGEVTEIKFFKKIPDADFEPVGVAINNGFLGPLFGNPGERTLVEKCDACNRKGEFDNSIALATEALKADPRDAAAFRCLGDAFTGKSQFDDAIKNYTKAIQIDQRNAPALRGRGDALMRLGKLDDALRNYNAAILLDAKDDLTVLLRGRTLAKKAEFEKTIGDATKVIRLNPKDRAAYLDRAKAHRGLGNEKAAAEDERKAKELLPVPKNGEDSKNIPAEP